LFTPDGVQFNVLGGFTSALNVQDGCVFSAEVV
jgi:hypothetical protein